MANNITLQILSELADIYRFAKDNKSLMSPDVRLAIIVKMLELIAFLVYVGLIPDMPTIGQIREKKRIGLGDYLAGLAEKENEPINDD